MASLEAALLTLLLIASWGIEPLCACSNVTLLSSQLESLLAQYDREAAPAPRVKVTLSLEARHGRVQEDSSSMRLLADLHMNWQDSRITWNATEWGCDWALIAAERLWLPDVGLVNSAVTADLDPLRARISSTGGVSWATRLDVAVSIAMELADWPNDVQTASFKFASRAYSADELDLTVKDLQTIVYTAHNYPLIFESGQWEIVTLSSKLGFLPSLEGDSMRGVATWKLGLRRRAPAQAFAARVAVAAALLMLVAAALLPPTNRAALAAAAAFTVAVWLCGAAWRLPGGRAAPRKLLLQGGVCAAAGAAAVGAALVLRLARLTAAPPGVVRSAVSSASRLWTFSPPPEGTGGASGTWVAAARLLDAVLLAILALVLLILLCVYL